MIKGLPFCRINLIAGLLAACITLLVPSQVSGMTDHVAIFGNLTYRDDDKSEFNQNPFIESLNFFHAAEHTTNLSSLFEFVAENSYTHSDSDVERLSLKYEFNHQLAFAVGRFHTPLGYWNSELHHGRILHDFAERPFFMEFDHVPESTRVLPNHIVGGVFSGDMEKNNMLLGYQLYFANPQTIDSAESLDRDYHHKPEYDARNNFNTSNLTLGFRSVLKFADTGWQIGLSGMDHTIIESGHAWEGALVGNKDELIDQAIWAIEANYEGTIFVFSGEYYYLRSKDRIHSGDTHSSSAFYVQLGYNLSPSVRASYRYSELDFDKDDTFYQLLVSEEQNHHIASLRYDLNEFNTFKAEIDYAQSDSARLDNTATYRLQWAFFFSLK